MVQFGLSDIIRAKVVVFGQSGYIRTKVVVFGQSGYIRTKVVLFGQKLLYSGKSGCNRERVFVFDQ